MQRVHENDLTGYILNSDINNAWQHLSLSAISTEKEVWKYKVLLNNKEVEYIREENTPINKERESMDNLLGLKAQVGSYIFESQYQQNPVPAQGMILKREWIYYYNKLPSEPDAIFQCWDTASKTGKLNDYSVCLTFLKKDRALYLINIFRDKLEYPDLRKRIISLHDIHSAQYKNIPFLVAIEDASSGQQLIQELRKDYHISIQPFLLKGSKVDRFYSQTTRFENKEILSSENIPGFEEYIKELLKFPNGKHDDRVDATVLALNINPYSYHSKSTLISPMIIGRDPITGRPDIIRRR